jgi:hypothetical protein
MAIAEGKKRKTSKSGDLGPIFCQKSFAWGFLLSQSGKDWPKEKKKKAAARVRMPISQELHFCRNPTCYSECHYNTVHR